MSERVCGEGAQGEATIRPGARASVDPQTRSRSPRLLFLARLGAVAVLVSGASALAADQVTDGTMELAGITNWPHTNISGTNGSAKATDQVGGGTQSLKGSSQVGKQLTVSWSNQQSVGSITGGSTVSLSLWYGAQYLNSTAGANGSLFVEASTSPSGPWTELWTAVLTPSTSFSGTSVAAQDVSAAFSSTGTYYLRLRFAGKSGNNNAAGVLIWWDDVALNVSASTGTVAGTVTATPSGCTSLAVSAPYTNDPNANNSLSWRTRTPSGTGTWGSSTPISHAASPYSFTIPGLTFLATYDVEVTYVDADGVSGTNPQTVTNLTVGPNCTGAGGASASQTTGATPSIQVTAPYTGDSNANNTLGYRHRTPPTTGTWVVPADRTHSGSPYSFPIASLSCGSSYDVEVTYKDVDGIGSGTATQLMTPVAVNNCTIAGSPTAAATLCTEVNVSAPFTFDNNGNGTVAFERGTSGTGPWAAVTGCGAVGGASSPRVCVDSTATAATTYYYRVTYSDPDAVGGTAQSVTPSVTTPTCSTPGLTTGVPSSSATGCGQVTVSAPFSGDTDTNSTTTVEWNTVNSWPGTVACSGLTGPSPRSCVAGGLPDNTPIYFRVSHSDPGGVTGTNPQVTGPTTTWLCKVTVAAASATTDGCSQVTVSAPFTGDVNGDSTTRVEWNTADSWPGTVPVGCGALTGVSPRSCVATGLPAGTLVYFRVTFTDPNGSNGTNPQTVTATTTSCNAVSGTPIVTPTGCSTATVSAPYTGDTDGDSTTRVEWSTTNTWPGTVPTGCGALTGVSPRTCNVIGLPTGTLVYFRVTLSDPDGVGGANPRDTTATTDTCNVAPAPPTTSVELCNRVNVVAPYSGDSNGNSTTVFKRGTASGGPFGTTVCASVAGASPRTCLDTTTVASTLYYYQVDFVDADGVTGTDPQVVPATTPLCPPILNVSNPGGQPAAANIAAGGSADVGLLTLAADRSTVSVTSIGIANLLDAQPGVDVLRLQLYDNGSGALLGASSWDGTVYRATTGLTVTFGSAVTVRVRAIFATGATPTRRFQMSVAASNVAVASPSTTSGTTFSGSIYTATAGSTQGNPNANAPTVLIVNPINGAGVTGPNFRVQVQVYNPGGLPALTGVTLSTNGGSTFPTSMAALSSYNVGTNAAIYEATLNLVPGAYSLVAQAVNSVPLTSNSATVAISVAAAGSGDGMLLVRDNSAQLCADCHAMATHSAQATGGKYGAWAVNCRDCHTPHNTTNIFLVKKTITPPSVGTHQPARPVKFSTRTGYDSTGAIANASYANADSTGPCQVCHTRTVSKTNATRYQNTANADTHYSTNGTEACTNCHSHTTGFKGKTCIECHTDATTDTDNWAADAVPAKISLSEWTTFGHGSAAAYASGNAGAAMDTEGTSRGDRGCLYCHDDGVGHNQTANPFRLANTGGVDGMNGACLVCHKAADLGFDPDGAGTAYTAKNGTKNVTKAHYNNLHGPTNNGGQYCWDCHDPHGDKSATNNTLWYMLHKYPFEKTVNQLPTVFAPAIEFRQEVGGLTTKLDFEDYVLGGLCKNCHADGVAANFTKTYSNSAHFTVNGSNPIDAPNDKCTDCHKHPAGFKPLECNGCHNTPSARGWHRTHNNVSWVTAPTSYTSITPATTATEYGYACARCHQGTHQNELGAHSGAPEDPYPVQVVFDALNPGASYNAIVPPDPLWPERVENGTDSTKNFSYTESVSGTYAQCSNTYCHSNGNALGKGQVSVTMHWKTTPGLSCTMCHTVPGANASAAHNLHATTYGYSCQRCHQPTTTDSVNVTDKRNHVDGVKSVGFDTLYGNSGGSYNTGTFTCSNTYCHSNGQTPTPGPYVNGPSLPWNGTKACDSCHAGTMANTAKIASGKHTNHINNAALLGTNLTCNRCHNTTVNASDAIISTANHVNGAKTLAFTEAGTYPSPPTCSNVYCHSSGQATPAFRTARWDDAAWATVCNKCHGTTNATGAPDYANGGAGAATANSHAKHVASAADCTKCHNATTTTGTSITAASTLHLNSLREVAIAAEFDLNGATSNYTASTKTCASVACHGSAGTPQWGGVAACLGCHSGTEGGPLADSTPNGVNAEWTSSGHGGAAGGTLASALGGCDYCHQLDAPHTPTAATNPYRLRYSATDNSLCLMCHGLASDPGISVDSAGGALTARDGAKDVGLGHYGAKHTGTEGGKLCWDCHDPHGVASNLVMVKQAVSRAADSYGVPTTTMTVNFTDRTNGGQAVGRYTEATNATRTGLCQACHLAGKTGTESTKYWRSDGTDDPDGLGGAAAYTSTHNAASVCTSCHKHTNDFAGAGGDCTGCHGAAQDDASSPGNARRAITPDFDNGTSPAFRSHHVGNAGGLSMGGTLTKFDCVVCHAEGEVVAGPDTGATALHKNGIIDLRNADNNAASFPYDKDAVLAAAGAAGNWNSSNATWVTQTSTNLDPFCLTCHDSDGATAAYAANDNGTALNPFGDTVVTNNYDQYNRVRVTDVKSRVTSAPANLDRDTGTLPHTRPADGRVDPIQGIFSRHAIRGQSVSVYGGTNANWDTTSYWNRTKVAWASNSVMGCADCHTTDGANASAGNAHGSSSEYLLKDNAGTAAEGTLASTYVCYACHLSTWYASGSSHTGSGSNFVETVTKVGYDPAVKGSRTNGAGNIFGYVCGNCHGGVVSNSGTLEWGTIHGTSQVFNNGSGTPATRNAYRFSNGNSLRFYDPMGWTGVDATCYTIGTADSFSSCTQHSGARTRSKATAGQRPLSY